MNDEELTKLLEAHLLWLESDGKQGQQAVGKHDFSAADLTNAKLSKACLKKSDFTKANLTNADLREAELSGTIFKSAILKDANLQRSDLLGVDFGGATLTSINLQAAILRRAKFANSKLGGQARLREADLRNADLEKALYLQTSQLAGADVGGAKLPEAIKGFEGLKNIAEATSNAQKLFVAMLSGCLYSWLTIGTTKDAGLLTNSATSPLPIIGTAIPIVGFYVVAPLLLIALYFYFHLNMQRLWESLADLPAIFPDGRPLDKMADPWLLNGLVRAHFYRLREKRPPLSRMQQGLSVLLAWWVVPFTLFIFWGRFLRRHDWLGSSLHITLLAGSIGFGVVSYRLARATLRGVPRKSFAWRKAVSDVRTYKRAAGCVGVLIVGLILYYCTHQAIDIFTDDFDYSKPSENRVSYALRHIGFRAFADIREDDVSTKLPTWSPVYSGKVEEIAFVKGARLRDADLKSAYAFQAFMVNADLSGADLRYAMLDEAKLTHADLMRANLALAALVEANLMQSNLAQADLTKSNLLGANLSQANLSEALLIKAVLYRASLKEANLLHADLVGASFAGADLSGANLSRAEITDTDFEDANLTSVNFKGVDLRSAKGLTKKQIARAVTDEKTLLPENLPPGD